MNAVIPVEVDTSFHSWGFVKICHTLYCFTTEFQQYSLQTHTQTYSQTQLNLCTTHSLSMSFNLSKRLIAIMEIRLKMLSLVKIRLGYVNYLLKLSIQLVYSNTGAAYHQSDLIIVVLNYGSNCLGFKHVPYNKVILVCQLVVAYGFWFTLDWFTERYRATPRH